MAEAIVARTVNEVQSPLLDRLNRRGKPRGAPYAYEVINHRDGAPPEVLQRSLRVPRSADWRLARVHNKPDGSGALLWVSNGPRPRGRLQMMGEGFDFTAVRCGNAWTLILPPEAPANVADLLT